MSTRDEILSELFYCALHNIGEARELYQEVEELSDDEDFSDLAEELGINNPL